MEYASGVFCHSSTNQICQLLVTTFFFFFQWPLTSRSFSTDSLTETCTPCWSCIDPHITPPTTTLPLPALRSFSQSAWTHAGYGVDPGQIWAESGPNMCQFGAWTWPSLSLNNPSCPRPRFSPRWAQTVTEKPYPSPPSELPPLEETGGQWLALEAKGLDCLSFINGKVTSSFAPLMMIDCQWGGGKPIRSSVFDEEEAGDPPHASSAAVYQQYFSRIPSDCVTTVFVAEMKTHSSNCAM